VGECQQGDVIFVRLRLVVSMILAGTPFCRVAPEDGGSEPFRVPADVPLDEVVALR
jgi:hypothetical protein